MVKKCIKFAMEMATTNPWSCGHQEADIKKHHRSTSPSHGYEQEGSAREPNHEAGDIGKSQY
uniref:Uncharacterized protein n=1 Tax=Oryza barthii TaxID=65489 RepID=A0A0D3GG44_9ORYZ